MNDELDSLTDAQLSELFAVEVAQTYWATASVRGDTTRGVVARFEAQTTQSPGAQPRTPHVVRYRDGSYGGDMWSPFATSADAVLPWLDQCDCFTITKHVTGFGYTVEIFEDGETRPLARHSGGSTFARSACIALIRAKRGAK